MEVPSPSGLTVRLDPSELRRRVEVMSVDARLERANQVAAEAALRDARRSAAEARECLAVAVASLDERGLAERKDLAWRIYRQALAIARDADERRAAATTWLSTVDTLNRSTRAALGQVLLWRERCQGRDVQVRDAEWRASAQRVRAEAAEDSCARARSDLADADRWLPGPASRRVGLPIDIDDDETSRPSAFDRRVPRVLASLFDRDADTLRGLAGRMADLTGGQTSRWSLMLQAFADTLVGSAILHDRLRFDRAHPLWAQLTPGEARAVMGRLRDLGFRYDQLDGWYGDRVPQPRDLALALAYAGIEPVAMRPLPSTADLARLPASLSVATLDHLLDEAPGLALDAVHRLVGPHAHELADVWDHWADLRDLLLAEPVGEPVP